MDGWMEREMRFLWWWMWSEVVDGGMDDVGVVRRGTRKNK